MTYTVYKQKSKDTKESLGYLSQDTLSEKKDQSQNLERKDIPKKQSQDEINIEVLKEIVDRYDHNRRSCSFFSRTPDVLDKLKRLIKNSPATATSVMRLDVEACLVDNKKFRHFQFRKLFDFLYFDPHAKHHPTSFQRLVCELDDTFKNGSHTENQLSLRKK